MNDIPSSTEALRFGWKTTLANLRPLLLLSCVGLVLFLFEAAVRSSTGPLALFVRVVAQALQVGLTLVWLKTALKLADGEPIGAPLFAGQLAGYFSFLLTGVLYALLVSFGLVLLIVPGVIWALQFGFAGFAAVEQKLDPIQALRVSSAITHGEKGRLFGFGALLLGFNLLGALAFGIGLAVTVPASFIAAAWMYRQLQRHAATHFMPIGTTAASH